MRRITYFSCILTMLIAGIVTYAFAGTEPQFDIKLYDKIAKRTIGMAISGNIDVDSMLADMERVIEIGIAGCKKHINEPKTPPIEVKMMKLVIENAQRMKFLTLDEIEAQWHEGGVFKQNGIDVGKFDHFTKVMCYTDAVVHPATCIICLKEYKKTKNEVLIEQVQDELVEVREHLKHLD